MPKVKILDRTGHQELVLEPREALEKVGEHKGEWVFVDGEYIALDNLSIEHMEQAREVVVTYPLQGG